MREAVPAGKTRVKDPAPWLAIGRVIAGEARSITGTVYATGDVFLIPVARPWARPSVAWNRNTWSSAAGMIGSRPPPPGIADLAETERGISTTIGDIVDEGLHTDDVGLALRPTDAPVRFVIEAGQNEDRITPIVSAS